MAEPKVVTIEGLTPAEILALPNAALDALVLRGEPIVFRAGTAEILGKFWVTNDTLVLELAQIDGGGEGVLVTLAAMAERYARREHLGALERRRYTPHLEPP